MLWSIKYDDSIFYFPVDDDMLTTEQQFPMYPKSLYMNPALSYLSLVQVNVYKFCVELSLLCTVGPSQELYFQKLKIYEKSQILFFKNSPPYYKDFECNMLQLI